MAEAKKTKEAKAQQKKELTTMAARPKAVHKKSKEQRKRQAAIFAKKRPRFRGRFGSPTIRRKSIEKWQRWRKSRGIDIKLKRNYGRIPNSGYQTPGAIRGLHPSGLPEVLVASMRELEMVSTTQAVRFKAGIGKKKRKVLLEKARSMGVHVLN